MTSINKLTKNSVINPGDLLVIWDEENQRTRSVSYDTLKAAVPYLESAEYVSPNLILTQSDGETITVAIPSGGDVISGLLDGQVPVKDQATGQLVYSGATVNSTTGQWTFDRTIEVPSSSLNVGDVVTISEGSTDLLISNNIDGIVSAAVSSQINSTGAKAPSYFKFGEEKSFIPQPFDSEVITTNPLIASSTGRVVSPDVRQINQTIFRADQSMPNAVAEIKDKASGMTIKYIPSRAAWEAETEEDRARNPGLNFIAGDNVIDYVSREEDTPGVFNIGVSPFRLTEGQEFEITIKADVMALKGISGVPYLAETVQDGPEVFLLSEDDQYIDEIIAGNNVTVDSTNPKKPVISASGGSGGAGVTIDVDGVEITTGVDTLDFDSATMTILDENPSDGTVKISAKIQDQTNFIGLFNTVSELQADYPTPKDGMYASVLDADGKPDDRYKSQSDSWVGIGAVSGDVFVNDNKSLGIITGDGLKYEDDSGSAKISLSGVTPVIEFDVTIDSTRTVSPSMVGEVITIIQTPPTISIPMIISLEAHANFSIGDTITISADRDGENPYTNYYFAVNYTDATGRNLVKYPANNITMIRTGGGWNVSMDGRYTNVSIRPKSQFGIPYAPDEQYNTPVNAFVFAESSAVEFDIDEDTNTRIVKIDFDNIAPDLSGYVEKYSRADLDYVRIAYGGKYNEERTFYPVQLNQDSNGWTHLLFTGYMEFQALDKATGEKGDNVLELRPDRVVNKMQPYFNEKKLISESSDASLNKLNITGVRSNSAYNNFSIAGSSEGGDDGDGLIFKTYIRDDQNPNKDYIQYFGGTGGGNQLANTESVSAAIAEDKAKGVWIGGVIKDTVNDEGNPSDQLDCGNPKHWVEFRKTSISASHYLVRQRTAVTSSEIVIHLHAESGMTSCRFRVQNATGQAYDKVIRLGEKWRFFLYQGVYPYFERIDDGTDASIVDVNQWHGAKEYLQLSSNAVLVDECSAVSLTTDGGWVQDISWQGVGLAEAYIYVDRFAQGNKWKTVDITAPNGETIRIKAYKEMKYHVKVSAEAGVPVEVSKLNIDTDTGATASLDDFNSKSGYNRLSSGGGSTHKIEFWENGSIFKLSNSKIEVRLLEGMQDEDGKRHGYVKYINNRGSDVNFEWYDRNGNQIINSSVPSVCPADTVVEIFANYSTDDYAINFSQSKVISSSISEAQTPSFAKFINKSTVTVDYPLDANGEQYRPVNAVVMILDTDNLISDLNITVTSSDSYDGHYNSIGVIAIDSNGEWTTQSRRNGYRLNDGTNTYCVYSDSLNSWVLLAASVDHNHIGSIAGGVPINLYNDGQLPESYGDYSLDNNLDSIESEYFTKADVDIDYHTNSGANSYFTVDFGSAKPAGIVFYK